MRIGLGIVSLAALLLSASWQSAGATAIAMGPGNMSPANVLAGMNLRAHADNPMDGLIYTATVRESSVYTFTEGNAQAFGQASGGSWQGTLNGTLDSFYSNIRIGVMAQSMGHAIADVRKIVDVELVNTANHALVLDIGGAYGISTAVSVSNILMESVLAYWYVGIMVDVDPIYRYGEFGRTIDCSYPLPTSGSTPCPNLYDSNNEVLLYELELDPGESLNVTMFTIARYEATAVPEPSTLVLFGAAGLGLLTLRRRARA